MWHWRCAVCLGLLDLANCYCESQLKRICERIIRQGITVENALMLYAAAIKYEANVRRASNPVYCSRTWQACSWSGVIGAQCFYMYHCASCQFMFFCRIWKSFVSGLLLTTWLPWHRQKHFVNSTTISPKTLYWKPQKTALLGIKISLLCILTYVWNCWEHNPRWPACHIFDCGCNSRWPACHICDCGCNTRWPACRTWLRTQPSLICRSYCGYSSAG